MRERELPSDRGDWNAKNNFVKFEQQILLTLGSRENKVRQ